MLPYRILMKIRKAYKYMLTVTTNTNLIPLWMYRIYLQRNTINKHRIKKALRMIKRKMLSFFKAEETVMDKTNNNHQQRIQTSSTIAQERRSNSNQMKKRQANISQVKASERVLLEKSNLVDTLTRVKKLLLRSQRSQKYQMLLTQRELQEKFTFLRLSSIPTQYNCMR